MPTYRVVERLPKRSLCALQCSAGHYHMIRALSILPALDAVLHGGRPNLGFDILVCAAGSGAIFRVIFESINELQLAPDAGRPLTEPPSSLRSSQASKASSRPIPRIRTSR